MNKVYPVGITGIGSHVPKKVITNLDLSKIVDTSDEWIIERTGIKERRIVEKEEATSDIATKAANKAIKDAKILPEEIDLIIVATVTPDTIFPSTACIVQKNIGAINATGFDISVGCTGFIYGLSIGSNFIKAGTCNKVLVIGAETLSKIVNWEDRDTCVLFGDGAGACILERCEEGRGILTFDLGADGTKSHMLIQPAGGSRLPASYDTVSDKLHTINMDGKEVFKFAVRVMEKSSKKVLEKANLSLDQLNFLIPHQANIRIINSALKKLELDDNKVYVNLGKYGNMSAASIPIALDEASKKGLIKKEDIIILVAFGAGLTWGSALMRWNK